MRKRSPHKGLRGMAPFAVGFFVMVILAGCGQGDTGDEASSREMTQAERDSVLAESAIPGAGVVGRALDVADSAQARSDRIDAETE